MFLTSIQGFKSRIFKTLNFSIYEHHHTVSVPCHLNKCYCYSRILTFIALNAPGCMKNDRKFVFQSGVWGQQEKGLFKAIS